MPCTNNRTERGPVADVAADVAAVGAGDARAAPAPGDGDSIKAPPGGEAQRDVAHTADGRRTKYPRNKGCYSFNKGMLHEEAFPCILVFMIGRGRGGRGGMKGDVSRQKTGYLYRANKQRNNDHTLRVDLFALVPPL
ncbi:hypothetical protein EVAR_70756_1 [Eumeta japonica]|uniref:Uncharacterized protein n=1 Tax=Eumeta variegata TaxID=151549 RepID=A0A4C1SHE4_EUMVA|nr:hypothetical protein EVAR_70756_1 [Eumeta japonica]